MAGGHAWRGGACVAGGMRGRGACVAAETLTAADGTHPTGMHSWLVNVSTYSFHTFRQGFVLGVAVQCRRYGAEEHPEDDEHHVGEQVASEHRK